MPRLIRNQMANGKYSINSTLVVTCAAKCEHVHRPVQLMPESLRRGQTGFRYGQDGSDIRDTRDEELSTWTLGQVQRSQKVGGTSIAVSANWLTGHLAIWPIDNSLRLTPLLAARAARRLPRSWRRLKLLVASG